MTSYKKRAQVKVSEVRMAGRGAKSPPTISVAELATNFKADVVELAGGGDDQKYVEYELEADGTEVVIDWMDAATYRMNLTEFEQLKKLLPDFEFKIMNHDKSEAWRESAAQRVVAKVLEHARRGKLSEVTISAPSVNPHDVSVDELAALIKSEVGDDPAEKFVEYTPDADTGGVQILWMNGLYELSPEEFEALKAALPDYSFDLEESDEDLDGVDYSRQHAAEAVATGRGSVQTLSVDQLARQLDSTTGPRTATYIENGKGGKVSIYTKLGNYDLNPSEFDRLKEMLNDWEFNEI